MLLWVKRCWKSTLIKIITGVHHADKGEMILNGKPVVFQNTNDSLAHSIAAIYQIVQLIHT